uniref:Uncharacterized protein n=1 Tax=Cacopsylla melanoneura TaxID=428564 RepID=A0A8D9EXB3_9HEMI
MNVLTRAPVAPMPSVRITLAIIHVPASQASPATRLKAVSTLTNVSTPQRIRCVGLAPAAPTSPAATTVSVRPVTMVTRSRRVVSTQTSASIGRAERTHCARTSTEATRVPVRLDSLGIRSNCVQLSDVQIITSVPEIKPVCRINVRILVSYQTRARIRSARSRTISLSV